MPLKYLYTKGLKIRGLADSDMRGVRLVLHVVENVT